MEKTKFFTREKSFYSTLFRLLIIVGLQNIVSYSVNMTDNIMLGNYGQDALAGAATVNQIFFVVQQFALAIGEALVVLASQYWGQKRPESIGVLTGIALKLGVICGAVIFIVVTVIPVQVLTIFTNDPAIIAEGAAYLSIMKYTFILFFISSILMSALRSVETVRISFIISVIALIVNVMINYVLIYGRFGMPRLGVRGAAIGTLVARILELTIVIFYILFKDKKLNLFKTNFLKRDKILTADYTKIAIPVILSQVLWAVSVPMQTAILGHLSSDAIAANSVATTFYQYLKVIVVAQSSASAVVIGMAIGRGNMNEIKAQARTLQVIDVLIGILLGLGLFLLRGPLLSFYSLADTAMNLADMLIIVMSIIMVGMSYQMPVSMGVIRGGGDAKFVMIMNMVSTWVIVIPLSFMSAFWWHWSVVGVVIIIQSDQIFKCLPTFLRVRKYDKWIKKLTR
ncbi:MATE family efflux transporter [Parasporobacterium paucivorans]|uniref:Probable multidrug resistance protein NorM n=1 Tax=Parasporobacterium paucivorans DSM 15970 TaxID=1122934 RepID=A0A1M6EBJ3_9FIRM|nr:MATE family efflux transporter [Parasporobacterium paucivorans]SHI82877.1 putative efflux protein, MATE family [Parasporobacterium paucivorans DSM 15970]